MSVSEKEGMSSPACSFIRYAYNIKKRWNNDNEFKSAGKINCKIPLKKKGKISVKFTLALDLLSKLSHRRMV
jgi:hypothetical protein